MKNAKDLGFHVQPIQLLRMVSAVCLMDGRANGMDLQVRKFTLKTKLRFFDALDLSKVRMKTERSGSQVIHLDD
jgi:hypothetical protein